MTERFSEQWIAKQKALEEAQREIAQLKGSLRVQQELIGEQAADIGRLFKQATEAAREAGIQKTECERLKEKAFDTKRWIMAANRFAWAHEHGCPRRTTDESCNCGLHEFLGTPRPYIESFEAEIARLKGIIEQIKPWLEFDHNDHVCEWINYGHLCTHVEEQIAAIIEKAEVAR